MDETTGNAMPEKFVAKTTEFNDGERRIVFVGDNEIGVFRHEGAFYAYSNFCLHQGWMARRFWTSSRTCRAYRRRSCVGAGWRRRKRAKSGDEGTREQGNKKADRKS